MQMKWHKMKTVMEQSRDELILALKKTTTTTTNVAIAKLRRNVSLTKVNGIKMLQLNSSKQCFCVGEPLCLSGKVME
jgi:hypothetical protein